MRHARLLSVLLLGVSFSLGACGQDSTPQGPPPPPPETESGPASGSWFADGDGFISALALTETRIVDSTNGTITGTGSFTGPAIQNGEVEFNVSGTDSSGAIRLQYATPGFTAATFLGAILHDTTLAGTLDGSGFNHVSLTFAHHAAVSSLSVEPGTDSTVPTRTIQFAVTALDQLGRVVPTPAVQWSLSDNTLGAISATGLVTAARPGQLTVTARFGAVTGQASLAVLEPVVSVTLHDLTTVVSASVPLLVTLVNARGDTVDGRGLTWSSSDSRVATISVDGILATHQAGSADLTVRVTLDGVSGAAHLTVRTFQPVAVFGGATHSCGLESDGTAACWGDGAFGRFGNGVSIASAAPVFASGAVRFATLTAGHFHTCGLTADGTGYCWGGNFLGQLGDGTTIIRYVPTPIAGGLHFLVLAAGYDYTCGLAVGGAAYCWGDSPLRDPNGGSEPPTSPVTVPGGLLFTALAAGSAHACGIATDSLAYCWGANDFGSLGDSTSTTHHTPGPVAGGHHFATIGAGAFHTCATTASGIAYCWGNDSEGEVGDSLAEQYQFVPSPVLTAERFQSIDGGFNQTCAVAESGQIYCWGGSLSGESGPNAGIRAYTPAPVGLTGTSVAAGGFHSCAVTPQGAFCWGFNEVGQLGSSSSVMQSSTPLRVLGQP